MPDTSQRPRIVPIAHGKTDVGRQREHNEDQFLVEPELGLFVVCDGMGGNNAGEVASALATTSLQNFFQATQSGPVPGKLRKEDEGLSDSERRLVLGVRKANSDVYEISSTRIEHQGMGSTLVAMHVSRDTGSIEIAHIGDSRCYRIRDAKIEQLTRDHSLIGDALAWNPNLSEEELARLPKNIISRALGLKRYVEVDVKTEAALSGDIYLLCSDGLSGMVKDRQILDLFLLSDNLTEACENLIAVANEAGGSDNITAVAVRIEGDPDADSPEIVASVETHPEDKHEAVTADEREMATDEGVPSARAGEAVETKSATNEAEATPVPPRAGRSSVTGGVAATVAIAKYSVSTAPVARAAKEPATTESAPSLALARDGAAPAAAAGSPAASAEPDIHVSPIGVDELLSYLDDDGAIANGSSTRCPSCGGVPTDGDAFCGNCGARIPP